MTTGLMIAKHRTAIEQNFEKTPFGMFGGQVLLPTTNIAPGVTIKAWKNQQTESKPGNSTFTVAVEEKAYIMMKNFLENWSTYMQEAVRHLPFVSRPVLHFPQTSMDNTQGDDDVTAYMAANSKKTALLTSKNASPLKAARVLDVTTKPFMPKDDKRLKIASLFLQQFGLEDRNTTHSVFQALAQFFDVDIGPSTSTLSTRALALDTLTTAMADALENLTSPPELADIMNQANEIDKMALSSTPKNSKTAKEKIPKKVKEMISKEVIIEIDDTELLPNEHKGTKVKR